MKFNFKNIFIITLLALISIFSFGCKKDDVDDNNDDPNINDDGNNNNNQETPSQYDSENYFTEKFYSFSVQKNIDEAKKLLRVAEKLANSVAEDDEVVIEKKEVVKPVIATSSEKPSFIIKFAKDAEELKKSDEKKIADMIPAIKANSDVTVKIISYYSANSGRNIAFSRLLNARKVLLEKDVPTSQIMIMVLEDEEKNAPKSDTLEVFFVR